ERERSRFRAAMLLEGGEDRRGRAPSLPCRELVDGGELEEPAQLVAVHAHHRQIRGDAAAQLPGGQQRADRHLVGGGEDRRGPLALPTEQPCGGAEPTLDREVRRLEQGTVYVQTRRRQRLLESLPAPRGDMEVPVELRACADVRDPGVSEREQMLGGQARDGDVVKGEGAQSRVRAAERDDRQTQ